MNCIFTTQVTLFRLCLHVFTITFLYLSEHLKKTQNSCSIQLYQILIVGHENNNLYTYVKTIVNKGILCENMTTNKESINRLKKCHANQESEKPANNSCDKFLNIEFDLSQKLKCLKFSLPIAYVYNPLEYARELHVNFVTKYLTTPYKKIMFLGMNPGPWGMCQTGIPFGETHIVNDWFHIEGRVNQPENEHPKRKIRGMECTRSEVSGKKFWRLFRKICKTPENFFRHCLVYNICPLAFLAESGKNVTPAEIKANDKELLIQFCDEAFVKIVSELKIEIIIGVGKFAQKRALKALKKNEVYNVQIISIPHPSPRNKKDFFTWEKKTLEKLKEFNILKYFEGKENIPSPVAANVAD